VSIAITTRNLTRRFGHVMAVDGVDLDIPKGQIFGFLGPNGCGKSTLIRMLCGLIRPSAGEVDILGLKIPAQAELLKLKTGYMTQSYSLYRDLSVAENLYFVADIYGLSRQQKHLRLEQLMSLYRLDALRHQLSGSLSGGERQRLALAAAVIHRPPLLFLDEPTSAVDPQSRRDFWESLFDLAEMGTTIVVSTHFMDEAERCHHLAILDRGKKVAEGSPQMLMQNLHARVVEVTTDNIAGAKRCLASSADIFGVTQLGLSLRVLVERRVLDAEGLVRQHLADQRIVAQVGHVAANLEDVFVVSTAAHIPVSKPAGE